MDRTTSRLAACLLTAVAVPSLADIVAWEAAANARADNVSASSNSGAGWVLNGTAGVSHNFGDLDALGGKPVDGSTVEFLFNYQNVGASISIGTVGGWSPGGEWNQFKLEQYSNTGKFGITLQSIADYTLATDSIFDQDLHVVYVRQSGGTIDMYINGVFAETHADKTNWRMDGGTGQIGARSNGTSDVATGTAYGVASYDKPLNATDIAALYAAYTAPVPEPASAVLGLAGLTLVAGRRRRA